VAEKFPDAMRLSIHPQPPHSGKFGLQLMRSSDGWLTPWHGVVLDDGVALSLVKRWEAEKLNASIVWRDGRPSHFVAPHLAIHTRKAVSV
jgi:pyoverdine/dityrosine biosynthesis protein Dit1